MAKKPAQPAAKKAPEPAGDDSEGFRNDAGQFTGNPATLEEKVDALVKMAKANGWSLPKELQ